MLKGALCRPRCGELSRTKEGPTKRRKLDARSGISRDPDQTSIKPVVWLHGVDHDIHSFPVNTRRIVGQAIFEAQCGRRHIDATPMHGPLRDVMEVRVDSADGNTYRVVYTAHFGDRVYALHAFVKKATSGTATPKRHLNLIERRLKEARQIHADYEGQAPSSEPSRRKR